MRHVRRGDHTWTKSSDEVVKVFVFTYDRFDSITTSAMLEKEGIEHTVLCHTEEQKKSFVEGGLVKEERLQATGETKGLANNRNYALDMLEEGEWALFLVDDLKTITELRNYDRAISPLPINTENQQVYKKRFDTPITMKRFLERARGLTAVCEKNGSWLGGWCGIDNPIYRNNHYKVNVLADGRALVVRKSELRFDTNVQTMDDYCFAAVNLTARRHVIVDQWLVPDCARYSAGGYGSKEQRMDQKIEECAYMVKTYPYWVAYKPKVGWPEGSHVMIRQRGTKPKLRF